METSLGYQVDDVAVSKYFSSLVNRFFKILPIREAGEDTLPVYIHSLQLEIIGCKTLVCVLNDDANVLTLLSILQYLHDNPDCPVPEVKREVFRAISICNKLGDFYGRVV